MCTIRWCHKEFKRKYNKTDSNHKKDFSPAFIDDILNEALFDYVELFATGNNNKKYRLSVEANQQRIDMLLAFIPEPAVLTPTLIDESCGIYEIELPEDYFHLLKLTYKDSECDQCDPIGVEIETHNNIDNVLTDEYQKPSKRWQRLVGLFRDKNKIVIYTNNEFELDELELSYIKCPNQVYFGGYRSVDGDLNELSDPIDPELDKYCHILIEIAVQNVARDLYDTVQVQLRDEKLLTRTNG
jgi:hypothetical protein